MQKLKPSQGLLLYKMSLIKWSDLREELSIKPQNSLTDNLPINYFKSHDGIRREDLLKIHMYNGFS